MSQPSYTDLVDVLKKAVAEHGPRRLFGTKKGGQWVWTTYQEFGKPGRRLPRRARRARHRPGRHRRLHRRQPGGVGGRRLRRLRARRPLLPDVRKPAGRRLELHRASDSGARILLTSSHAHLRKGQGLAGQDPHPRARLLHGPARRGSSQLPGDRDARPPEPQADGRRSTPNGCAASSTPRAPPASPKACCSPTTTSSRTSTAWARSSRSTTPTSRSRSCPGPTPSARPASCTG